MNSHPPHETCASGRTSIWSIVLGDGFSFVALANCIAVATASAQEVFPPPAVPTQFVAVTAAEPITIDGNLDEAVWRRAITYSDFVQKDPVQGAPATFRTDVRIATDDTALYVAATCYQPRADLRVQNLERDFSFDENDLFGIAIDGFRDRRNAVAFQTTPYGNQRDVEVIDGSVFNSDWNARWYVRTRIHEDRWTVEMAIPWRILRYPQDADRFGVIFARNIRKLNENTAAPPVPRAFTIYRMAYQGEIVGTRAPPPSTNLQFNPYALVDDVDSSDAESEVEFGGELKWAISPSTVLDVTVNTDFAQAEVDRQVVNLERFSVFFPERRQFFLENANLFNASVTNWIRPFFSRRIGLDESGRPIPIDGGLRLTRRSPKQEIGLLAMSQQATETSPSSAFAVARYSRNLAGQSRLGGMLTWRRDDASTIAESVSGESDNFTYTVDGLWRPSQSFGIQAMLSASHDDAAGSGLGSQLWMYYENNWLYAGLLEYLNKDYEPGVGLEILDETYVMHSPAVSFDLRFDWLPDSIRSFNPGIEAYVFESADDGDLLFGYAPIRPLRLHFQNGAQVSFFVEPNWQRLEESFFPAGIEIAPGDYDYTRYRLSMSSDQSATLSASFAVESGDYFDGELTTYSVSGRFAPLPQIEITADYDVNRIRALGVERQDETTQLVGLGLRLAVSPRFRFSAFYQQNSLGDQSIWNARLSWEYRPLSYLYVVYNRSDDSISASTERSADQLIAKLTYLFEV